MSILVLINEDGGNSLDDDKDDALQLIRTIIVSAEPILLPIQSIRFISLQSMRLIHRDDDNDDGQ